MKLALIRRRFSETGGAELYLQRLLAALREAGHELHLFAESWENPAEGVTLHAQSVTGTRAQRPWQFARAVEADLRRETFHCVFSLERTLRQDVYRAGDGLHRVWLERRRQFAPAWRKAMVGLGAFHRAMLQLETQTFDSRNTRHIIANSEMVKREILQHFTFPSERIHVVRNGVDVARFQSGKREETRARFGVKPDEFLLLFVGSGWERKGLKLLLHAVHRIVPQAALGELLGGMAQGMREFRKAGREVGRTLETRLYGLKKQENPVGAEAVLPPDKVKLLVVGKGRPFAPASSHVIFAGPMANVEDAYAAADLFVFLPIYEPSANVVFEALAAGLPVVTSAQNGAAELIHERVNGTVIEDPSDTRAVVEAIQFWWSRRFGSPPIEAAALSLDRNVRETVAVLESAAGGR
ncbi:MAG: glycosyltransferase family 4 protein [Verrucomicrobiales bacterium]|nr:glycosyltransferase family 4 protein [Verrucomicrobiales bacterium]